MSSKLSVRPVKPDLGADCAWIARWDADPETRPYVRPFRDAGSSTKLETPGEIKARLLAASGPFKPRVHWIVFWEGVPVGTAEALVDPPHRLTRDASCAWFGIHIGEASMRGKGIGARVLAELESWARGEELGRAEVGVFEFNEGSLRFFVRHGYAEIGRVPEFTFWRGRKWADVRLAKSL